MMATLAAGLDGHAVFLHWGILQISLANLIVIGLMLVTLILAVVVPFPHAHNQDYVALDEERAGSHARD